MKVSVIGPGAMGCLFAARMAQADIQTTLVDYRQDRAERLNASGLTVESAGGSFTAKPMVTTAIPNDQDLIIVLVKAYSTKSVKLPANTPVLTLQNGLGNIETICTAVGSGNVIAGVTSEAAMPVSEAIVKHTCVGVTRFGSWTSCPVQAAEQALGKAGFPFELTAAPGQTLWEKVAVSSGVCTIAALLNVPNGTILDIPEVRQLMRDLVVEGVKVASTEGYRFSHSLVEQAEQFCRDSRDNISPMLQDIRAGRRTEVEAISGEILRRAQLAALPTPRTRVVWQLLKGLEQR